MSPAATAMSMKLQHSQGLLSSTVKIEEEDTVLTQKQQGTVTILASPCSLRRTLSADMSSKKWLPPQNIAEEEKGEDVDEAERERLDIWSSIQLNKKEEQEKDGTFDTWSSLLSLKSKDEISKSLPAAPYIHPLVKTKSSLSDKSLEICTESLGSETGSDGLVPSYPPSETGDSDHEQQQQEEKVIEPEEEEEEEEVMVRYNYYGTTKKTTSSSSSSRSFPPPLPSLSSQTGPSLQMRPHRDNGRLFLQAVSLPSNNNFSVQRQDGRLVLTFANNNDQEEDVADNIVGEELEEEFGAFEEDHNNIDQEEKDGEVEDEDEDEYESDIRDVEPVIEKEQVLCSGIENLAAASFKINTTNNNKAIGLVNRNPKWSEKFNEVVSFEDVDVQMVQSLPPRPRVARMIPSPKEGGSGASAAAAASGSFNLNAYEHYWRTKPTAKDRTNPLAYYQDTNNDYALKMKNNKNNISSSNKIIVSNENQQLLVLRGKNGDYLVHNLKSCKDSRRSFLFWEPYCIATS